MKEKASDSGVRGTLVGCINFSVLPKGVDVHPLERIGGWLIIIGFAAFAGVFLVVIVNATWPEFLRPVQSLYAGISDIFGSVAIIIEAWLFVGPGFLIKYIGTRQRKSALRK
jgi:hypothetical protein